MNRIAGTYYWLTERLYNEFAWAYDPVSWLVSLGGWSTVRSWVGDYIAGRRILEIGFGTGELLIYLAAEGYQINGLELSPAMLRQTTRKLHKRRLHVPITRGVSQHLPFRTGSFDTIITTYPAGFIFDPATWHEAARITLSPDHRSANSAGRLVILGIGASSSENSSWLQKKLFGFPLDGIVKRCGQLAQDAGLELEVQLRDHKGLEFPILIAEN